MKELPVHGHRDAYSHINIRRLRVRILCSLKATLHRYLMLPPTSNHDSNLKPSLYPSVVKILSIYGLTNVHLQNSWCSTLLNTP